MNWNITTSARFRADQAKTAVHLADLIDREIVHLSQRAEQLPKIWMHNYTLRRNTQVDVPILEIEVGGGFRILAAQFEGQNICLLMCGQHDSVYDDWDRNQKRILDQARRGEETFLATGQRDVGIEELFRSDRIEKIEHTRDAEWTDDWIFFLDQEQARIAKEIEDAIINALLGQVHTTIVLIGGPGTGKTSILLKLMGRLSGEDGVAVGLRCSPKLSEYLAVKTSLPISNYRSLEQPEVLFIDDPVDLWQMRASETDDVSVAVVAVDPLQMDEVPRDADLTAFLNSASVTTHHLRECYRQKEGPGRNALEISRRVAASTPYLDAGKIEDHRAAFARVHEMSLDLEFTNSSGSFTKFTDCKRIDVKSHANWVLKQNPIQAGWPSIAIVIDSESKQPDWLEVSLRCLHAHTISLSRVADDLKGLDYDHVLIFLSPVTYSAVFSGFKGSGQKDYNNYRKLRIPFTRARDSVAVFQLGTISI